MCIVVSSTVNCTVIIGAIHLIWHHDIHNVFNSQLNCKLLEDRDWVFFFLFSLVPTTKKIISVFTIQLLFCVSVRYIYIKKIAGPWNRNHTLLLLLFLIDSLILTISYVFIFYELKNYCPHCYYLRKDKVWFSKSYQHGMFFLVFSSMFLLYRKPEINYLSRVGCLCVCSPLSIINIEMIGPLF